MGLYGTIVVEPTDPDYWPQVNRELTLTLDDILLTDGTVASFSRTQTTHTAMGRFGDVLLVNGDPDVKLAARAGEVVRLYLVNTANTRVVFNVAIPGARMKLVGGDSGRYEHEQFVQSVILAPSERVVVDVQFTEPAVLTLEHHTPDRAYPLAEITVTAAHVTPPWPMFRHVAVQRGHGRRTRPDKPDARSRPGQDGGLRRRDGHGRPRHRPRRPIVYILSLIHIS